MEARCVSSCVSGRLASVGDVIRSTVNTQPGKRCRRHAKTVGRRRRRRVVFAAVESQRISLGWRSTDVEVSNVSGVYVIIRGMRSRFRTRSQPANLLRPVICSFLTLVPHGFVLDGQK